MMLAGGMAAWFFAQLPTIKGGGVGNAPLSMAVLVLPQGLSRFLRFCLPPRLRLRQMPMTNAPKDC